MHASVRDGSFVRKLAEQRTRLILFHTRFVLEPLSALHIALPLFDQNEHNNQNLNPEQNIFWPFAATATHHFVKMYAEF